MNAGTFVAGPHEPVLAALGGGAGSLVQHSPLGFVVAFGAGIISFVSPCVLPLVPSYLSMMSGVGVSAVAGGTAAVTVGAGGGAAGGGGRGQAVTVVAAADRRRLLLSTLLFVAGFSFVFALLEATASALFHPLETHKQMLGDVAGGLIVAMGVLLAFQLPWFQRQHRVAVQPSRLGPWVAPVMGMTFAFAWTPCITPVLAAVLSLASSGGTLARGEEMLVAYSLGLGVPFVITGLAFGRLSGALRFARRHSRAVSMVSGCVLAALGVLIITGEVGTISSWSSSLLQHIGLGGLTTG
ncbi:MAG TPA: cytochrome c biogenesis protein CcdA [Acidimicrobiales bacterium]|nr:cytochrome c biogenesis protein CcdA [Acidimicrobiales bacterium]